MMIMMICMWKRIYSLLLNWNWLFGWSPLSEVVRVKFFEWSCSGEVLWVKLSGWSSLSEVVRVKFFEWSCSGEVLWGKLFGWSSLSEVVWVKFFEWSCSGEVLWVKLFGWSSLEVKKIFLNLWCNKTGDIFVCLCVYAGVCILFCSSFRFSFLSTLQFWGHGTQWRLV